jgi:alanyl-tRNA synthetase
VVARVDDLAPDYLRNLAQSIGGHGPTVVVLAGSPDGSKVALVVASGGTVDAGTVVKQLAAIVGGGGGGSPQLAAAGGKDVGKIDDMLAEARRTLAGA